MKFGFTLIAFLAVTLIAGVALWLNAQIPGAAGGRGTLIDVAWRVAALVVIASVLISMVRSEGLGTTLRSLAAWIGIGAVLFFGYSYWHGAAPVARPAGGDLALPEPKVVAPGIVALHAGTSRHFRAVAEVNGHRVQFMVDTGASDVALTRYDARRVGIDPNRLTFDRPYRTANGTSFGAAVRIGRIRIGDIVLENVDGHVAGGELGQSLLGMSFLRRLSGFEVRGDELILRR